jgi:hypothetical protein
LAPQGDEREARQEIDRLLPASLEDFVAADHPVRVIDALVNKLDLAALGFSKAMTKDTGRKPYAPGDLLKPYVYGYINQVNTSRRLERECQRNLEVIRPSCGGWWFISSTRKAALQLRVKKEKSAANAIPLSALISGPPPQTSNSTSCSM